MLNRILVAATALIALVSIVHDRVEPPSAVAVATLSVGALVDLAERRIPDTITATAGLTIVVGGVAMALLGSPVDLESAAIGAGMMSAPLLVVHVVSPAAMGLGDVKAAAVLGAAAGLVHWQLPLVALAIASASTAAIGLARRQRFIAFGPGLVGGTVFVLLLADLLVPASSTPSIPGAVGG